MTKQRAPLSIDGALTHIADTLSDGWREMAEVTRRKEGLVRSWGDPERREQIPLVDALVLDQACHQAGGGSPLFDYYSGRMRAAGLQPCAPVVMYELVAAIVRESADAGAAGIVAAQPGATRADHRAYLREIEEAIVALERARTVQAAIVEADTPAPVGLQVFSAAVRAPMATGPP